MKIRRLSALLVGIASLQWSAGQSVLHPDTRSSALPAPSNLSREADALYLEDITTTPMQLKVKQDAVVYNNLAADRRLGLIPSGRMVSVVAINEKAIRVRGKAEHDNVSGWVGRAFLEEINPKVMENIQKMMERQKLVNELIQHRQVAMGMTSAEVEKVLGSPTKRSSHLDKTGSMETLEYITYKIVPQQISQRDATGQLFYTLVNTKVETGRKTLTFENNIVSSIEETVESKPGAIHTVPLPIELNLIPQ